LALSALSPQHSIQRSVPAINVTATQPYNA
jgi:hypothetical protein